MKKIAIVTDSNSGITQEMGKSMGIYVIPMPFFIDGELFLEDITLTQEEFYKRLGDNSDISTASLYIARAIRFSLSFTVECITEEIVESI